MSVPASHDPKDYQYEVLMSNAILFNLALAHHLAGIEARNDSTLLQNAAALYESAFKMARRENFGGTFFLMAIINNMGHIYLARQDQSKADSFFRQLVSMFMFLVDSQQIDDAFDLDGFFYNAYQLVYSRRCHVAPAA